MTTHTNTNIIISKLRHVKSVLYVTSTNYSTKKQKMFEFFILIYRYYTIESFRLQALTYSVFSGYWYMHFKGLINSLLYQKFSFLPENSKTNSHLAIVFNIYTVCLSHFTPYIYFFQKHLVKYL